MANFQQAIQKAERLTPAKINSSLFKFIRGIEQQFINFNIQQIEDSKGSDNGLLENKDKRFSGVYSETTEGIALFENPIAPKKAGEPYNFLWTGEFIKGFQLFIKDGTLELFSTGTGSDEKAQFFKGYEHLFGLTDQNLNRVIKLEILPFFITYFRSELI